MVAGAGTPGGVPGIGHLPHVDGLRGLAIAAVVAFHLVPDTVRGGFLGVDLFFVISGFVVAAAADRLEASGAAGFAAAFFVRRVRRILPALFACLSLTGIASMLLLPPGWLSEQLPRTGMFAYVGLSNFVLAAADDDYFAPRVEFNPFAHTWSLGVEEQFYLAFPLLMLVWRRGARGRRLATVLTTCLLLASVWAAASAGEAERSAAFYLPHTRLWQLASGVLLFQLLQLRRAEARVRVGARRLLAAISLLLLLLGFAWGRAQASPWPDSLPVVLAALGLIATGASGGWVERWLICSALQALGRVSYSLYLWHWPVIVLMRWTGGVDSATDRCLALLLSLLLAWASYRWIETPVRRSPRLDAVAPRSMLAAALLLALAGGWGFAALYAQQPRWSLSVVARAPADWQPDHVAAHPGAGGCAVVRRRERLAEETVRVLSPACDRPVVRPRLWVAGDSHALGYLPLLHEIAALDAREIRILFRPGCAFLAPGAARGVVAPACAAAQTRTLELLEGMVQPGDIVLLPSLRLSRLVEAWGGGRRSADASPDAAPVDDDAQAFAQQAISRLAGRGARLVFEAPKPLLPAPVFRCVDRFNRGNPHCAGGLWITRDAAETQRARVLESMRALARADTRVSIWDPLPSLCGPTRCEAMRDGRPLFFDGDHLSAFGNRQLVASLRDHLRRVGGDQSGS